MDEKSFYFYLKRGGRSDSAADRCVRYVKEFETYLAENLDGKPLGKVSEDDLDGFVDWADQEPKPKTKTHLWALRYYFDYVSDDELRCYCSILRQERIKRRPHSLAGFRGVVEDHVRALALVGIKTTEDMLTKGATKESRKALSNQTGIPEDAILEMVRLSDLSRIQGIKGIRARLYVDAGVDSIEKLAQSNPEQLREELIAFVEETNFDGIAPLPAELRSGVRKAKELPKIVEY